MEQSVVKADSELSHVIFIFLPKLSEGPSAACVGLSPRSILIYLNAYEEGTFSLGLFTA